MPIQTTAGPIPDSVPIILVTNDGYQVECAIVNETPEHYLVKPLIESEFSPTARRYSNQAFNSALWRVSRNEEFVRTERTFDLRQLSDSQQLGLATYLNRTC